MKHGYELVNALRLNAQDCLNPERYALLLAAADDIERLIKESRKADSEKGRAIKTVRAFVAAFSVIQFGNDGDCGATRLVDRLDSEIDSCV